MDFSNALKTKVKPELNHIYTEKPFMTREELEMGWYCREHALHLYGLAVLLGKKAEICTGDFILYRPNSEYYHSVGVTHGHAWCRIDDQAPVDISMTIKHIYNDLRDISLIYNDRSDLCSPFQLRYLVKERDDVFLSLKEGKSPLIAYNEKGRKYYDLLNLLYEPFQFLHRPPKGFRHFPDFFYAITYHCYRLVVEDIKLLSAYRDPKGTVKGIMKFNLNAKKKISRILKSNEALAADH